MTDSALRQAGKQLLDALDRVWANEGSWAKVPSINQAVADFRAALADTAGATVAHIVGPDGRGSATGVTGLTQTPPRELSDEECENISQQDAVMEVLANLTIQRTRGDVSIDDLRSADVAAVRAILSAASEGRGTERQGDKQAGGGVTAPSIPDSQRPDAPASPALSRPAAEGDVPLCPDCKIDARRPKCLWELGAACPRHAVLDAWRKRKDPHP